jgi:hypothetical protein
MANWLKKHLVMKPEVEQIFEELEKFKDFCAEYGYPYNEADLGKEKGSYGAFKRFVANKPVRDNWENPTRRYHNNNHR